jgi:hypothetical protein
MQRRQAERRPERPAEGQDIRGRQPAGHGRRWGATPRLATVSEAYFSSDWG